MKEKIKLKCISIARDGGSKQYVEAHLLDKRPGTMKEAQKLIDNAYYLDGAFGSPTRGKFFRKKGGEELNKDDYEFDR